MKLLAKLTESLIPSEVEPQAPLVSTRRIAIILDHPIEGQLMTQSMRSTLYYDCLEAGLDVDDCYITTLLAAPPTEGQYKFVGKNKRKLNLFDPSIAEQLRRTFERLAAWKPSFIIGRGDFANIALKQQDSVDIDEERGAPFRSPIKGVPALLTFSIQRIWMQYGYRALVLADFEKARKLAETGWSPPKYNNEFLPSYEQIHASLDRFIVAKPFLAVDIETTYETGVCTCIALAWNTTSCIVIPFVRSGLKACWTPEQEALIWKKLAKVLSTCPLVGQNAVHFDLDRLLQVHRVKANFVQDTMLALWELYPDFPKSLAFGSSLYTSNPYWKGVLSDARSGKVEYWKEFEYCGLDTIITYQLANTLAKALKQDRPAGSLWHYRFNIATSRVFQYMSMMGGKLDKEKHAARLAELKKEARSLVAQWEHYSKRKHIPLFDEDDHLTTKERASRFNLNSHVQVKKWLYEDLGLEEKTKLAKNDFGEMEEKVTADYLTMLYLFNEHPEYPEIKLGGQIRRIKKRISALLAWDTRPDGNLGWTYNIVGTESGRASGYKPLDGKGVQPQNIDRRDKDLIIAPEGYYWIKADLEGADAWTVAAMLASLGHPQMRDDLLAGIKPAQRSALAALLGPEWLSKPPQDLKPYKHLLKSEQGDITYRIHKPVSHGTNYGMKERMMHMNIFKQSDGDLFIHPHDCAPIKQGLMSFYGIGSLHERMRTIMLGDAKLTTACGSERQFFGRRDNSMLREMLSYLPQFHTGLTTNVVLNRLFYWEVNRLAGSQKLLLRPVNQVHDETDLLCPIEQLDLGRQIFKAVREVPLTCWGEQFTIPFESNYGPSWGECKEVFV